MSFVAEDNLKRSCVNAPLAQTAFEYLRNCICQKNAIALIWGVHAKMPQLFGSRIILTRRCSEFFQIKHIRLIPNKLHEGMCKSA